MGVHAKSQKVFIWKDENRRAKWWVSSHPPTVEGAPSALAQWTAQIGQTAAVLLCGRVAPVGQRIYGVTVTTDELLEWGKKPQEESNAT